MGPADLSVRAALVTLRDRLAGTELPLDTPGAESARDLRAGMLAQLDDYILPRLGQLDAPLLAVVGGSTGAGKSTLVNSIVGRVVSETGVLRPTTRSPVLVHYPEDAEWFGQPHVLPHLPRAHSDDSDEDDSGALRLVADDSMTPGMAVLDAPDIDSVVTENRELATQLLAAGDLWLFVTTAARYADAVPWDLLTEAARRRAAIAVVLDRVAPHAVGEVRAHLATMLAEHDLGDAALLVVEESSTDHAGMLPEQVTAIVRDWVRGLAADESARSTTVRRTLDGAIDELARRVPELVDAADQQGKTADVLRADVVRIYDAARRRIDAASSDGSLLRGEILARWQDFVGAGDLLRSLEAKMGRLRDRVTAFLRGRPQPVEKVEEAIEHGVSAMVVDEANRAAEEAERQWRGDPAGRALLGADDLSRASSDLPDQSADVIRDWQAAVLALVRSEGAARRSNARLLSFGVNGLALALMIVVFASTAGLTGLEVGVAGGATVVGQKVLEAVFGDEAVRRLAAKARSDLMTRVNGLLDAEAARFTERLDALPIDRQATVSLREALALVGEAKGQVT